MQYVLRVIALTLVGYSMPLLAQSPADSSRAACEPKPAPSVKSAAELAQIDAKGSTAYREAWAIKDPEKRVAALHEFISNFPNHFSVGDARVRILETNASRYPKERERILREAEDTLTQLDRTSSNLLQRIASVVQVAGFTERAEQLAVKAVEEATASYKQMEQLFSSSRASALMYLGRTQLHLDKLAEAESSLQQAYEIDPNTAGLASSLAYVAQRRNNDREALEYLLSAAHWSASDRRLMENLYRKLHANSLAGLEEELDARYINKLGDWVNTTAYRPTPARTERVVLAEVFSGSGCAPCVAVDLAFEGLLERYAPDDVAILFYHNHTPVPDPLSNTASIARAEYYGVRAVPTAFLDGAALPTGGGTQWLAKSVYARVSPGFDKRLEVAPDIELKLNASLDDGVVRAEVETGVARTVEIESEATDKCSIVWSRRALKLHIALVEDRVGYVGENRVRYHAMVVRDMATPDGSGVSFDATRSQRIGAQFAIDQVSQRLKRYLTEYEARESEERERPFRFVSQPHELDPNRLGIVAFVQDEVSRVVLQSRLILFGTREPNNE